MSKPKPKTDDELAIYTDGGCRGNPGPGAWAAVLSWRSHRKEISGFAPRTTNNRMELTAAIEALKRVRKPCRIRVVTDSEYLRRGITEWLPRWLARGWKTAAKKPVQNRDLWEALHDIASRYEVRWDWVQGHSGDAENERCDQLVNEAMDRQLDAAEPQAHDGPGGSS
jgi:ribonuclease HI